MCFIHSHELVTYCNNVIYKSNMKKKYKQKYWKAEEIKLSKLIMSITFQIISLVLMQIYIHNVCDGVNCCVYCYAIYNKLQRDEFFCLKSAIVSISRFLCVFLFNLKHMCMLNVHFIHTKEASMLQKIFLRVIMSYSEVDVNVMMNKLKRFKP
jgi:hypothetical protein